MTKRSAIRQMVLFTCLAACLTVFQACPASHSNSIIIPAEGATIIRLHCRLSLSAINQRWVDTGVAVKDGDFILLCASGRVLYGRQRWSAHWASHVYSFLRMKIGKEGEPVPALTPTNNHFFSADRDGNLLIKVHPIWKTSHRDIPYGGLTLDIFLFSSPDEEQIYRALAALLAANPDDAMMNDHLRQITQGWNTAGKPATGESLATAPADFAFPAEPTSGQSAQEFGTFSQQYRTVFQGGHNGPVRTIGLSPNGRLLVSGGDDTTLRLWELPSGREIRIFSGHSRSVRALALTPDGKHALSADSGGGLLLWELATARIVHQFTASSAPVTCLAISQDGRYAATGTSSGHIRIWSLPEANLITSQDRHDGAINALAFSHNGRFLLSGGWDGAMVLSEVPSGDILRIVEEKGACINTVAFSADDLVFAGGDDHRTIQLLDTATGKRIRSFSGHKDPVTAIAFSSDGRLILSGSQDNTLRLWETASGKTARVYHNHTRAVTCVSFSADDRYLFSGSVDGGVAIQETESGRVLHTLHHKNLAIHHTVFTPDGEGIVSGGNGGVFLRSLDTGSEKPIVPSHDWHARDFRLSPDGRKVLVRGQEGAVQLLERSSGLEVWSVNIDRTPCVAMAFSPDGRKVAVANDRGQTIHLLDTHKGIVLSRIAKEEEGDHPGLLFTPDGSHLLSPSEAFAFRAWRTDDGKEVRLTRSLIQRLIGNVTSLATGSDGRYLLSGNTNGSVQVWQIDLTNRYRSVRSLFRGHHGAVNAVALSPDNCLAASAGADGTLRLWTMPHGRRTRVLHGHIGAVTAVAFSKDGRYLLSGGADGATRLWNLITGQEIAAFFREPGGEWIILTPDGYYDCSPEGNDLIYWAYPGSLETFSHEQFSSLFKKPDIVRARLEGDSGAGRPAPKRSLPPRITMRDHLVVREVKAETYLLALKADTPGRLASVRVFINGKSTLNVPAEGGQREFELAVPLFTGPNRITAMAYDDRGVSSNPKFLDVIATHTALGKPDLHVVSVGISRYPNLPENWQLEFAHRDAIAIAEALKQKTGGMFKAIYSVLQINEAATAKAIVDTLGNLENIGRNDVVFIFLAGHGLQEENGRTYLLTSEGRREDSSQGRLDWTALDHALSKIPCRVILLLDACHAGAITTETVTPNDELADQFFSGRRNGVMVFSASKGRQYSMESEAFGGGHGIFTYALIRAIGQEAHRTDANRNGYVEFMELVDAVQRKVHKETGGRQTPWLSRKELFGDIPITAISVRQ